MYALVLATCLATTPAEEKARAAVAVEMAKLSVKQPAALAKPTLKLSKSKEPTAAAPSPYERVYRKVQSGEVLLVEGDVLDKPAGKYWVFLYNGDVSAQKVEEAKSERPFADPSTTKTTIVPSAGPYSSASPATTGMDRTHTPVHGVIPFGGTFGSGCRG